MTDVSQRQIAAKPQKTNDFQGETDFNMMPNVIPVSSDPGKAPINHRYGKNYAFGLHSGSPEYSAKSLLFQYVEAVGEWVYW